MIKLSPIVNTALIAVCVLVAFFTGRCSISKPTLSAVTPAGDPHEYSRSKGASHSVSRMQANRAVSKKASAKPIPKNLAIQISTADIKTPAEASEINKKLLLWVSTAPEKALQYAEDNARLLGEDIIEDLLVEWSKNDADAAWLVTTKKHPQHINSLVGEIAKEQPDKAWGMATELTASDASAGYEAYVSVVQGIIFNGDNRKAIELINNTDIPQTIQSSAGGYSLYNYVLDDWTRYAPNEAADWVASIPDENILAKETAHRSLVDSWVLKAPKEALDYFLENLPEGPLRNDAVNDALSGWAGQDIYQASEWISEFGNSPEYDPSVFDIAISPEVVAKDPSLAMSWVDSIVDPELQQKGMRLIFKQWLKTDKEAALQKMHLMGRSFSEKSREILQRNLQNNVKKPSDGYPTN